MWHALADLGPSFAPHDRRRRKRAVWVVAPAQAYLASTIYDHVGRPVVWLPAFQRPCLRSDTPPAQPMRIQAVEQSVEQ